MQIYLYNLNTLSNLATLIVKIPKHILSFENPEIITIGDNEVIIL